jgi:hypothetical protein
MTGIVAAGCLLLLAWRKQLAGDAGGLAAGAAERHSLRGSGARLREIAGVGEGRRQRDC